VSTEFGRFIVRRDSLRWRIFERGYDGIERPIHPIAGRFWRWMTAARLAQEFNRVARDACWFAKGSPLGPDGRGEVG